MLFLGGFARPSPDPASVARRPVAGPLPLHFLCCQSPPASGLPEVPRLVLGEQGLSAAPLPLGSRFLAFAAPILFLPPDPQRVLLFPSGGLSWPPAGTMVW